MENTLENKAKFFAQYWGHNILMDISHGFKSDNEPNNWHQIFDNNYLGLKPLSSITDEDAVEVYSLYFGTNVADDWSGDTGSAYFNPKKIKATSSHALRILSGEDYLTGAFEEVAKVVDYLRSKGYALPYMGLSVEKQIQYGWIKLIK